MTMTCQHSYLSDDRIVINQARQPTIIKEAATTALVQVPEHIVARPEFISQIKSLCALTAWAPEELGQAFGFLDLDFTIILIQHQTARVLVANGHRNSMSLYFCRTQAQVEIRDDLPRAPTRDDAIGRVSSERLISFIASGWASGPFEYSDSPQSIYQDWMRVPPGHFVLLDKRNPVFKPFDNIFSIPTNESTDPICLSNTLRDAVDKHLGELAKIGPLFSEFSGGIDSGIVIARAQQTQAKNFRGGLAFHYPYYEFQREEEFRQAIVRHLGILTQDLSPEDFLPFSLLDTVPHHDEPTVVSTSWCQFRSSTNLAALNGGRVVLTGHGGDTLFRFNPQKLLIASIPTDIASWFPKNIANKIRDCAFHISEHLNNASPYGFGGLWHPSMIEPGLPARFVQAAGIDVQLISGLLSRDTLRAAAALWPHKAVFSSEMQKPFAHFVFNDDLPQCVWQRPGKVDHLGIVFRGINKAQHALAHLIDRNSQMLGLLGVRVKAFRQFFIDAVHGKDAGNPIFSQLISLLIWLEQHSGTVTSEQPRFRAVWQLNDRSGTGSTIFTPGANLSTNAFPDFL